MQRFYGGDPGRWIDLPAWLFWAYTKAQARLEAEERLEALAVTQAATNNMEPTDRKNYITELRSRADTGREARRAARPRSLEELAKIGGTKIIAIEAA